MWQLNESVYKEINKCDNWLNERISVRMICKLIKLILIYNLNLLTSDIKVYNFFE